MYMIYMNIYPNFIALYRDKYVDPNFRLPPKFYSIQDSKEFRYNFDKQTRAFLAAFRSSTS